MTTRDEFGFVFVLLEEGAPDEAILGRLADRRPGRISTGAAEEDREYFGRLATYLRVYRSNLVDDAGIPDRRADADEQLAMQRRFANEVLPRLDRLIGKIVEMLASER